MARSTEEPTHQPARALAGYCPMCSTVVVLFNNYEVWPLVHCMCGWHGPTTQIARCVRFERNMNQEDS